MNFRYLQAFKPLQVFNEAQFRLRTHRTKRQDAILGFEDGKRAAVTEPVPVPNLFGHYDLALLAHVNHCHGRKLPPARAYSNPFLPHGRLQMGTWTYISNLLNEPPETQPQAQVQSWGATISRYRTFLVG